MADTTPTLIKNDPWLAPYEDDVRRRMDRCAKHLEAIKENFDSIHSFAGAHHHFGIHHDAGPDTWTIREWAPAAKSVSLLGDFNDWDPDSHPLESVGHGVWQLIVPGYTLKHEQRVKLHIVGGDDSARDRIPACITRTLQDPETHDYSGQIWHPDESYQWKHTFNPQTVDSPLIYEAHVGMGGEEARLHTYREFADNILPRVKEAGYNIVQFMAIAEHPYYGSFGYHVSNFFAPSSRYGTPEDLKYLVDTAHGMGLAVIMDAVHSHDVKNYGEGLNNLDGSGNLYFHADGRGDHSGWDSKCFDYGRYEVQRFLLSNLRYWIEEFRFDGFRFDGITSMLYWHRGNTAFDHYDKYFRDNVDEDAILYLQLANTLISELKPGAIVIAEDMSGMPGLCRPLEEGGIGFTHRLAMSIPDCWIKLLKHTPDEDWNLEEIFGTLCNRRHGEANIAYAESHDQALVGDKTLAFWLMDQDMYWHMSRGELHPNVDRGIALHKMIRLITLAFGGEGWLNFMGNEFGHPEWLDFPREGNNWSYHHCRRQWSLVDNEELRYGDLGAFDKAMIDFARESDLLGTDAGQMLHVHNDDKVIIGERGNFIFAFNFSFSESYVDYRFPAHAAGSYKVVLNSDARNFGGHDRVDESVVHKTREKDQTLSLYLPTRTAIVLKKV